MIVEEAQKILMSGLLTYQTNYNQKNESKINILRFETLDQVIENLESQKISLSKSTLLSAFLTPINRAIEFYKLQKKIFNKFSDSKRYFKQLKEEIDKITDGILGHYGTHDLKDIMNKSFKDAQEKNGNISDAIYKLDPSRENKRKSKELPQDRNSIPVLQSLHEKQKEVYDAVIALGEAKHDFLLEIEIKAENESLEDYSSNEIKYGQLWFARDICLEKKLHEINYNEASSAQEVLTELKRETEIYKQAKSLFDAEKEFKPKDRIEIENQKIKFLKEASKKIPFDEKNITLVKELREELAESKKIIEKLENCNRDFTEKLENFNSPDFSKEIENLSQQLKAEKTKSKQLEESNNQLNQKIEDLNVQQESSVEKNKKQLQEIQAKLEKEKKDHEGAINCNNDLRNEIKKLQESKQELVEKFAQKEQELNKLKITQNKIIEDLNAKIKILEQQPQEKLENGNISQLFVPAHEQPDPDTNLQSSSSKKKKRMGKGAKN